jgi:hypothetical protein
MYSPFAYPSPYGGIYDTSGPDDSDDPQDEVVAEEIAESLLDQAEAESNTTGALGLRFPNPMEILGHVNGMLGGTLGVNHPKVRKVAAKVAAKVPVKAKVRPRRVAAPAMRLAPPPQPAMRFPAPAPARERSPINSISELKERVKWAQLASLTGAPLTVGIGATTPTTIPVTRTGWVLDWATNTGSTGGVALNLTYGQQPNTIFNATPLECWSPLAANPTPIDPIFVTMPASFNVTIQNPTAAAIIVTWTMSGIPAEHMSEALTDPDVAEFLGRRGMAIARAAQGGGGSFGMV